MKRPTLSVEIDQRKRNYSSGGLKFAPPPSPPLFLSVAALRPACFCSQLPEITFGQKANKLYYISQ